jgi:hypothetical protein
MRKSISSQALLTKHVNTLPHVTQVSQVSLVDAVILTRAPIHHAVSCVMTNEFPDEIISKDLVACLASPCDPPSPIRPPPLIFDNEESRERYIMWLKRIRRAAAQRV